jgi:hypothetical protein
MIFFTLALCLALFLFLDAAYSAFVLRSRPIINAQATCFKADAVRHHSLQPDCQCERHWGKQSYPFATNNLGFRDQQTRDIPMSVNQPRVLLLGDSFTEGMSAWGDTYVGKITAKFPQYDFLNGGVESYAPSNYLNVTRQLLDRGVQFDEVIVFIDMSDAQDEAAFYRDKDPDRPFSWPSGYRPSESAPYLCPRISLSSRRPDSHHCRGGPSPFELEAWLPADARSIRTTIREIHNGECRRRTIRAREEISMRSPAWCDERLCRSRRIAVHPDTPARPQQ